MVAGLVMPLGALYEISGNKWILGAVLCDMWTSSDVLACTASILHLVAIAVDRYWAVTDIEYIRSRNKNRIGTMILLVWSLAFIVSLAPILGWKDPQFYVRLETERKCLVSQDVGYQIFATCATFYVPLIVILLLYWKIFQTARRRIRRRPGQLGIDKSKCKNKTIVLQEEGSSRIMDGGTSNLDTSPQLLQLQTPKGAYSRETTGADISTNPSPTDLTPDGKKSETIESIIDAEIAAKIAENICVISAQTEVCIPITPHEIEPVAVTRNSNGIEDTSGEKSLALATLSPTALLAPAAALSPSRHNLLTGPLTTRKRNKESIEGKRERKAAKTLAIITGAFIICWVPFFVMALTMAICTSCHGVLPIWVDSSFLWLGYFNSTLNPLIYTIFSPEFRQAFKRILCGRNRYRRRK